MKSVAWFLSGLLLSVVAVFLIGFLSIQISGIRGGVVFGIDNQLAAVTDPSPGFVQRLAVAAIAGACVAVLAVAVRHRSKSTRALFRSGFIVATIVQVAVSAVLSAHDTGVSALNDPLRPWAEGWVVQGGMDSTVHLLLIVALFLRFARPLAVENAPPKESEAG